MDYKDILKDLIRIEEDLPIEERCSFEELEKMAKDIYRDIKHGEK